MLLLLFQCCCHRRLAAQVRRVTVVACHGVRPWLDCHGVIPRRGRYCVGRAWALWGGGVAALVLFEAEIKTTLVSMSPGEQHLRAGGTSFHHITQKFFTNPKVPHTDKNNSRTC